MTTNLYYTAPSDSSFDEMKKECTAQWNTHDNTHGYVDEKVDRIKDIKNIEDNFMYMFAMFDINGQRAIASRLTSETKKDVHDRLVSGGNPDWVITEILGV